MLTKLSNRIEVHSWPNYTKSGIVLVDDQHMTVLTVEEAQALLLHLAETFNCKLMSLVPERENKPTNNGWLDHEAHVDGARRNGRFWIDVELMEPAQAEPQAPAFSPKRPLTYDPFDF